MRFILLKVYQVSQKTVIVLSLIYLLCFIGYLAAYALLGDRFWPLALLNTFAYAIFLPLAILLPLTLITRSWIGTLALLPVIVILGVWVFPYLKSKPILVPTKNAIRVVTSNTLWDNSKREAMLQWLRDTDADIIFLQEISYNAAAGLSLLKDAYPYQPVSVDSDEWGGNYILSRIPILTFAYVDLGVPKTMQPQRIAFQFNGTLYVAYNIHLEWPMSSERPLKAAIGYFSPSLGFAAGYDDSIRNLQIDRLVAHLQSESYPYFLAGDFNTSDQSPSYNQLVALMSDSFREAGSGFGATWPVASVQHLPGFVPPLIRIDYVFHSNAFKAVRAQVGEPIGSDHLPLFVTLALVE